MERNNFSTDDVYNVNEKGVTTVQKPLKIIAGEAQSRLTA